MSTSLYQSLSGRRASGSWRQNLEHLRALQNEYQSGAADMSRWEQQQVSRHIQEEQSRLVPAIETSVAGELRGVYADWEAAFAGLSQAQSKEAARWKAAPLRDEMQLAEMRVNRAKSPKELDAIWREAHKSGDAYKILAVSEVLTHIAEDAGKFPNPADRIAINEIAQNAQKTSANLHRTKEIEQSEQIIAETRQKLGRVVGEAETVSNELHRGGTDFQNNAIARELRRLKVSGDNVQILLADSPEVTGVVFLDGSNKSFMAED